VAPTRDTRDVDDEELTREWEDAALGRAVTHHEHLRIAWLLISRHGREEGSRRVSEGTLRNCLAMEAADRFDGALTDRWNDAIATAVESSSATTSAEFLVEHPEFLDSRLFGLPAWKRDV
jgi:hypothetical protein